MKFYSILTIKRLLYFNQNMNVWVNAKTPTAVYKIL